MFEDPAHGTGMPPQSTRPVPAFLTEVNTAIFDHARMGVFAIDSEFRVTLWNPVMERLSGLPFNRVAGRPMQEVFPYLVGTDIETALRASMAGRATTIQEHGFTVPETGRLGSFESHHSPLRAAGGAIVGVLGILREITARDPLRFGVATERTEGGHVAEAIAAIAARYAALFGQAAVGIAQVRRSKEIIVANARFCTIVGRSSAELQWTRLNDLLHPDDPPDQEALDQLFEHGRSYVVERRYVRPDGSVIWTINNVSPILDESGQPAAAALMVQDITELKATQTRLEDTLAEKGDLLRQKEILLGEVNHRVKNSLQLVSSLFRLQAARLADTEAVAVFADAVSRVEAIAQLHEWLYKTGIFAHIALGPYLAELCANLERSGALDPQTCRVMVESDAVELPADRAILVALIVNELVTNSVKYAGRPDRMTEVRVRCRDEDGMVRVAVLDNGPGFPDGFDLKQSSGFGMTIVTRLTQQLGGTLAVSNSAAGAEAHLAFPAAAAGGTPHHP
jgi:PAS domain S-box-containing protein